MVCGLLKLLLLLAVLSILVFSAHASCVFGDASPSLFGDDDAGVYRSTYCVAAYEREGLKTRIQRLKLTLSWQIRISAAISPT